MVDKEEEVLSLLTLVIDVLKLSTIVVLQDVQSEIKTEAEECQDVEDVTQEFISCVRILKEVKDSLLLYVFI